MTDGCVLEVPGDPKKGHHFLGPFFFGHLVCVVGVGGIMNCFHLLWNLLWRSLAIRSVLNLEDIESFY